MFEGGLVTALKDIELSVFTGERIAVVGPSGSGKSSLVNVMSGCDEPTTGVIEWRGSPLDASAWPALRGTGIGIVFQDFLLLPTLTAIENVTLPMSLAGRKPDKEWLDTVVETVGLRNRLHHRPSELSGGQQQRVAVARALASKPHIVFADEPTGNLDSKTGAEILAFMRQAVRELGQTIVMVTHDPMAASYADRAVFLADGRIVDELNDPTADSVFDRMRTLGA